MEISYLEKRWLKQYVFCQRDRQIYFRTQIIGYNRFAFGSDYPVGNPVKDIERILKMGITDDEKELLLGANTRALYFVN